MKFFILFLILFPMLSFGQSDYPRDITVSWLNPDLYVDGSVIEAGDLTNIRIEIYRQNDLVPVFTATIPDTGEGLSQSELFVGAIPQPGTYRIEGYAIVIDGTESDVSESVFQKYIGKPRSITSIVIS